MTPAMKEKLLSLPLSSGVYLMKDSGGNIIYVGKAKNLKRRVNSYFIGNDKPIKTFNLVSNIADFDYIVTASDTDAFLLENNLIKKYQPHFNILLKDGRNYPYLKINLNDDFPRIEVTRKVKKDGSKYFGPYFNGISPNQILKIAERAFSLRTCSLKITENSKPVRPCLNYSMGLCSAPCAKYITKQDYKKQVEQVVRFLKGDTKTVENILINKMQIASDSQNYEKAIEIREEIKSLNLLRQRYTTQFSTLFDQDVVGYYSTGVYSVFTVVIIRSGKIMGVENFVMQDVNDYEHVASTFLIQYYDFNRVIPQKIVLGAEIVDADELQSYLSQKSGENVEIIVAQKGKNKKLCEMAEANGKEYLEKSIGVIKTKEMRTVVAIQKLKDILHLDVVPKRMECFDISHTGGTNSVASMTVFLNGEPARAHYRKFKIKSFEGNDDFASLQEVLARRLAELKNSTDQSFSSRPDLVIIDGGKGQLSSVKEIFDQLQSDIPLCSLAEQNEEIFVPWQDESIKLKRSDIALQVLQRIRDEAHRFAITFHRSKRKKTMATSALDSVKGIGKVKKLLLFEKFGNIENMKNASTKELMLVKGVTEGQAIEILKVLNQNKS